MIVWIDAANFEPDLLVFGMNAIERHLRAIRQQRLQPTAIRIDGGARTLALAGLRLPAALLDGAPIEIVSTGGAVGQRLAGWLATAGTGPVLCLSGDSILDPRVLRHMSQAPGSTAMREGDVAAIWISDADRPRIPGEAASLAALAAALPGCTPITEANFGGFIRKLRRNLAPYILPLRASPERDAAERFLFRSNYKGSTDLFTKYVYPPLVWRMVRPLAAARIHPNWVTLLSIVMTLAAVPCFAYGYFWTGFALAYGMSVLDSVDGKLARLTFTDSNLGNLLDHGLDLVHPPLWYAAWAIGLAGGDLHSPLMIAGGILILIYVCDRLVLKIYSVRFQRGLHTHAPVDAFLRSFIARRNINLPLFTIGYALGYGEAAFYAVVAWQAATLAYHTVRVAWIFLVEKAVPGDRAPAG
ncbi:MAG: CDP-alcohol phosphatidyltransferase family protein [Dongiaceae bacterium]